MEKQTPTPEVQAPQPAPADSPPQPADSSQKPLVSPDPTNPLGEPEVPKMTEEEHEAAVAREKEKLLEEDKRLQEEKENAEKAKKPMAPKPIVFKKTAGLRPDKALLRKSIQDTELTKEEWIQLQNEMFEVVSALSEGLVAKKYGQNTKFFPDERKVYFIDRYRKLTWSKVGSKDYEKTFSISEIDEVKLGKQTENIKRFKGAVEDHCLSINVTDRSIDLEFKNKEERDKFHKGVMLLVKLHNRLEKNPYIYQFIDETIDFEVFEKEKPKEPEKKGLFSFF